MCPKIDDAVEKQRRYYAETASRYDAMHAHEGDDDSWNLTLVSALLQTIDARSVLDVGAGTGRGVRHLKSSRPDLRACGIEPVAALIDQAAAKSGGPQPVFVQGSGEALPFADASFDAVCSFAILHHVPQPDGVISEMLRVARKAVLIADSNRFGQGRWPIRIAKLALYKAGLWRTINYLKTSGKGYLFTLGDGVAYSYSVYDSFHQIAEWSERLMTIPAEPGRARSWLHPLLTSGGVLIFAVKKGCP